MILGVTLADLVVLLEDTTCLKAQRRAAVDLHYANALGRMLLYIVILVGNKDTICDLLKADSKCNVITSETALHLAAATGDIDLVRNLLTSETDIN